MTLSKMNNKKGIFFFILLMIILCNANAAFAQTGSHDYISVPFLAIIYPNYRQSPSDPLVQMTSEHMTKIEGYVERLREFCWRNSGLKLNLEFKDPVDTCLYINRELSLDQMKVMIPAAGGYPAQYLLNGECLDGIHSVYQDIIDNSLDPNAFSAIMVFYAWEDTAIATRYGGGGTYFVNEFGYLNCLAAVTVNAHGTNFGVLSHEFNHVIDHMYEYNGISAYPSIDNYLEEGEGNGYGHGDEICGGILREWPLDDWLLQSPWEWGRPETAPDNDNDGVPDSGIDRIYNPLAITESEIGSFDYTAYSDSDGLTDLQEVMAHVSEGSNPTDSDTDDDGIDDHLDFYPTYDSPYIIPSTNPVIDGDIASNEHQSFNYCTGTGYGLHTFVDWNSDYLFLSFFLGQSQPMQGQWYKEHQFKIVLDLKCDGPFIGLDNYLIFFGFDSYNNPYIEAGRLAEGDFDDMNNWTLLPTNDFQLAAIGTENSREIEFAIPRSVIPELDPYEGQDFNMSVIVSIKENQIGYVDGRVDALTGYYEERFEFMRFIMADNPVAVVKTKPGKVDFSEVAIPETGTKTLEVINWGTAAMDLTGFSSSNPSFSVLDLPVTIGPMETAVLDLTYTPVYSGDETGTITFTGTAPNISEIEVTMAGTSINYISAMQWVDPTSGGMVHADRSGDNSTLRIGDTTYERGIGMLAITSDETILTVQLAQNFNTFISKIGVKDSVCTGNAVYFKLYGDGVQIYESQPMDDPIQMEEISIDVSSVDILTLKSYMVGSNQTCYGSANWAEARVLNIPITTPIANWYQAEDAAWNDGYVGTTLSGFTGTGYVNTANESGTYIEWTFYLLENASAQIDFRYANGSTLNREMELMINGETISTPVDFSSTGSWTTWEVSSVYSIPLDYGFNTIRVTSLTSEGAPNMDRMDVRYDSLNYTSFPYTEEHQAENATWDNANVESMHVGYTGSGYVNTVNETGTYIEWTVYVFGDSSGDLIFRFANGSTLNREMELTVNGTPQGNLDFSPTGSWITWNNSIVSDISFLNGYNTFRLTALSSGGAPNMDKLDIVYP